MSDLSGIEIGRLIQTVDSLSAEVHELRTKELPALRSYVKGMEDKMNKQDIIITKGKTLLLAVIGGAGAIWAMIELFIKLKIQLHS